MKQVLIVLTLLSLGTVSQYNELSNLETLSPMNEIPFGQSLRSKDLDRPMRVLVTGLMPGTSLIKQREVARGLS